jgi:hypothetical protein
VIGRLAQLAVRIEVTTALAAAAARAERAAAPAPSVPAAPGGGAAAAPPAAAALPLPAERVPPAPLLKQKACNDAARRAVELAVPLLHLVQNMVSAGEDALDLQFTTGMVQLGVVDLLSSYYFRLPRSVTRAQAVCLALSNVATSPAPVVVRGFLHDEAAAGRLVALLHRGLVEDPQPRVCTEGMVLLTNLIGACCRHAQTTPLDPQLMARGHPLPAALLPQAGGSTAGGLTTDATDGPVFTDALGWFGQGGAAAASATARGHASAAALAAAAAETPAQREVRLTQQGILRMCLHLLLGTPEQLLARARLVLAGTRRSGVSVQQPSDAAAAVLPPVPVAALLLQALLHNAVRSNAGWSAPGSPTAADQPDVSSQPAAAGLAAGMAALALGSAAVTVAADEEAGSGNDAERVQARLHSPLPRWVAAQSGGMEPGVLRALTSSCTALAQLCGQALPYLQRALVAACERAVAEAVPRLNGATDSRVSFALRALCRLYARQYARWAQEVVSTSSALADVSATEASEIEAACAALEEAGMLLADFGDAATAGADYDDEGEGQNDANPAQGEADAEAEGCGKAASCGSDAGGARARGTPLATDVTARSAAHDAASASGVPFKDAASPPTGRTAAAERGARVTAELPPLHGAGTARPAGHDSKAPALPGASLLAAQHVAAAGSGSSCDDAPTALRGGPHAAAGSGGASARTAHSSSTMDEPRLLSD